MNCLNRLNLSSFRQQSCKHTPCAVRLWLRHTKCAGYFLCLLTVFNTSAAICQITEAPGQAQRKPIAKTIPRESIRILFVGDIMLDGGPGHLVANGKDPFKACAHFFEGVDLSIGNLECVLGDGGEQQLKPYVFHGAQDSPRFLKKYFQAVSLANNHSMDYGPAGMEEMLSVLEREKIPYFGGGRNLNQANSPFVIEIKGHKIAILGFNEFRARDYAATKNMAGNAPLSDHAVVKAVTNAREKLGCNVVIPYLHWGQEMTPTPRPDQEISSRKWIDSGATAVIGSHPHVTQTIESYRGSPIIYSLGNFVFDYFPVDPLEWIGWVAIIQIEPSGTVSLEIKTVVLDPAGCPKPVSTD